MKDLFENTEVIVAILINSKKSELSNIKRTLCWCPFLIF